jgi:hypothetical protein
LSNAEINARIARIYYQALTDAAGYPNGMPYWPEMSSNDKYHYGATALDFLRMMQDEGLITLNVPMGFGEIGVWGQGECKALMDHFDAKGPEELEAFNKLLAQLNDTDEGKGAADSESASGESKSR